MVSFSFKASDKILPKNNSSIKVLKMFFIIRLILDYLKVVFEAHSSSYLSPTYNTSTSNCGE